MRMNFTGIMQITPTNQPSFELEADWKYDPEWSCWYGAGQSFPEEICSIKEGEARSMPVVRNVS